MIASPDKTISPVPNLDKTATPKGFFTLLPRDEIIRRLLTFAPLPEEEAALVYDQGDQCEQSGPCAAAAADTESAEFVARAATVRAASGEGAALGLEGRVLARDVRAVDDVPMQNRAAMDGYALRAADSFGASEANPTYLACTGSIAVDALAHFSLEPGCCAALVTGAPLPEGADAVVMVEYTAKSGKDPQGIERIEIRRPVAPGAHVLERGADARANEVALMAGTVLRPQEIGLLAAVGACRLTVRKRPRVCILATGDEVVPAQIRPRPGQVRDVNSHALAAMVREAGGLPQLAGIVPDNADALAVALDAALAQADVVLLSGGSSVGARDFTLEALGRIAGSEVFCHGAALSPGKPLILARCGHKSVWGLPGQVASAQVVMFVLGQPFLRYLAGDAQAFAQQRKPMRRAVLARNVASQPGREDYVRVRLVDPASMVDPAAAAALAAGLPLAMPVPGMSGLLRTLLDADGLMRIDANLEGLVAGHEVDVLLLS